MEFLQSLGETLSTKIGGLLPGVLGAILVLIIGLILAGGVRRLVRALFRKTSIDEKIASKLSFKFNLGDFIAKLVFY